MKNTQEIILKMESIHARILDLLIREGEVKAVTLFNRIGSKGGEIPKAKAELKARGYISYRVKRSPGSRGIHPVMIKITKKGRAAHKRYYS